ncbi:MAG: cellulase family glycosylhydrolase [Candidatus Omnitrophica bacterium]|nr:cellulase family glycosylhydrolase [Candidatus Omnitrophota bacterium]
MQIKGVNLGSWLLMEGYILGGRNFAESAFKQEFKKRYGARGLQEFERSFRENFIAEDDFKNIASMGASVVRVPFNYHIVQNDEFSYFDKLFSWAGKHGIKVILDLHAAPGAQNEDWHSDGIGKALFWQKDAYRHQACRLWETVANRYKDQPQLLGYDVLNEPVIGDKPVTLVKEFYRQAIRAIRAIDKRSIIFLEGDIWAQRIDYLKDLIAENIQISIHTYQPLKYVFNFKPFDRFPGSIDGAIWDKDTLSRYLEPYCNFSRDNKVGIFVGEFGINWRGGFFGEIEWLDGILDVFDKFGFGYTYWTYKAMAHHVFPDGIYQYIPDSKYICREGPVYGWESYYEYWKKEKKDITKFWRTENFTPNSAIINTLKKHFLNNA